MGGKESKAPDNTANVINTVEVVDHKQEIEGVQHTLEFIAALLIFLALLMLMKM